MVTDMQQLNGWVEEGLRRRFPGSAQDMQRARADAELAVISEHPPLAHVLVALKDLRDWCKGQGVTYSLQGDGPSLEVCFLLGLTPFDPIEHKLFCERLLAERPTKALPSLPFTVARDQRDRVVDYLRERWSALPVLVSAKLSPGPLTHPDLLVLGFEDDASGSGVAMRDFRTGGEGVWLDAAGSTSWPLLEVIGTGKLSQVEAQLKLLGLDQLDELPLPTSGQPQAYSRARLIDALEAADDFIESLQIREWPDVVAARGMHWPGALSAGLPARYGSHADADTPTGLPEALASKVEPILADTRGLLLFQEQFSRIAREVVGMADESLYRFRAALTIGGPTQRLAEFRRTFNELLAAKGYSSHQSDAMWEFMGANAPSTFSKSHALAEALLIHVLAAEPLQPVAQDQ